MTMRYDFKFPSTDLAASKYLDTSMKNTHPDLFVILPSELLNNE